MAVKVFITGATGYIAGDIFYALSTKHPEYEYTCLARTTEKGSKIKQAYPSVNIVVGDLDDSTLLAAEASKADIVIPDASDHVGAAQSIAAGMRSGHSKERPGYYIHTSGTGILTWEDDKYGRLGEYSDHWYNDWKGVSELTHLPDEAFHRNVDKIVLEAANRDPDSVKVAIVCPPTIYGLGRGPLGTRSRQAYELASMILKTGTVPIIGKGLTRWNNVHIHDLSELYVGLVEAAVSSEPLPDGVWGSDAYYLTDTDTHQWAELARFMGKKAEELGYLSKPAEEKSLTKQEALDFAGFQAISWGLNSLGKAERAAKLLSWSRKSPSLYDEVPAILKSEKELLQG